MSERSVRRILRKRKAHSQWFLGGGAILFRISEFWGLGLALRPFPFGGSIHSQRAFFADVIVREAFLSAPVDRCSARCTGFADTRGVREFSGGFGFVTGATIIVVNVSEPLADKLCDS